jgi:hypothetical protein
MLDKESVTRILAEYRQAAVVTDDLADTEKQNQAAHRIHACYKALRETEEGRAGIIALMSDPSPHVRAWAAAHSLQWMPDAAQEVLEALRDENVFPYSFDAEMTLEEYRKGRLSFDY